MDIGELLGMSGGDSVDGPFSAVGPDGSAGTVDDSSGPNGLFALMRRVRRPRPAATPPFIPERNAPRAFPVTGPTARVPALGSAPAPLGGGEASGLLNLQEPPRQPEVTLSNLGQATIPQIREKEAQLTAAYKPSLGRRILGGVAETIGVLANRPILYRMGQRFEQGPLTRQLQPYDTQLGKLQEQGAAEKAQLAQEYEGARLEHERAGTAAENLRGQLTQLQINKLRENPQDKYLKTEGSQAIFSRPDGSVYAQDIAGYKAPAPKRLSNPFEAFAYGNADEKKAAQGFISFEKQTAARYRAPTEFEERYRLYQNDPPTYKAMFGTKAGGITPAQAVSTLRFLDGRRREIERDYTMPEEEKQRRLAELNGIEQPFQAAAGIGTTAGPSTAAPAPAGGVAPGASDRVDVISPSGQRGTIPRGNLAEAQRRGYRPAGLQPAPSSPLERGRLLQPAPLGARSRLAIPPQTLLPPRLLGATQ